MALSLERRPLVVVVGSGGVGKTTLAAALGLRSARQGQDTLVMTFDPSLRLKDSLGVGDEARERPVPVDTGTPGVLHAGLLDARRTFDGLVRRYAPDDEARRRILENRFYRHLRGGLAGVLEYMAVERLYEVSREGGYDRVILDTPPTREALSFLEAPQRIISFLESGALSLALKPWFDDRGRLRPTARLGLLGRSLEGLLDRLVGLGLLSDMAEFFQAFGPLFAGFRERALEVQELLRSPDTLFLLVAGPGEGQIPDTMFFARRLEQSGHRLGPVVINGVHPRFPAPPARPAESAADEARRLLHWLGERDHWGLVQLRELLPDRALLAAPMLSLAPTDLGSLERLAGCIEDAETSPDPPVPTPG